MSGVWPLVGRDEQLRLVTAAINRRGTAGVVVAGGPGLGKTRLATEALAQAAARGCVTAWSVATHAAASIPFGPLVHLLPEDSDQAGSRLDLLRQAGRTLAQRAAGRPMVLGVDDAHLLDDASAALVHHLATTSTAFVLATVRTDQPSPDAVTALWKDAGTEWLELAPLSQVECSQLIEAVLGGQVDGATLHELWRLSVGNALFLRELVNGALEAGTLEEVHGVWRATGTLTTSTRLVEIVEARIGRLAPEIRAVVELVAVGEPLCLSLLESLVPASGLDAADQAGLLALVYDQQRTRVRLAHPLYGELLRATTPPLRALAIRRRLADAIAVTGARRRDDLLRLAVWQLESGVIPKPALLVNAARQASSRFFDNALAERLAAAAYEADGDIRAGLVQAEAQHAQGKSQDADRLLVKLEPQAITSEERARVALLRANTLLRGLGRSEDALKVLVDAEAGVVERRWRDEFALLRATASLNQGQPIEALNAAKGVLTCPDAHPRAALRAIVAIVTALAYRGRTGEAIAAADHGIRLVGGSGADASLFTDQLFAVRSFALRLDGRLEEAEELALARYRLLLERRADDLRASCALILGDIALARGAVRTAIRRLRESVLLHRECISVFGLHGVCWSLGGLALAAAIAGEATVAQEALDEFERVVPDDFYVPHGEMARAWVAVLRGSIAGGRTLALQAAANAAARGCEAFEAAALHDVARLGGPKLVMERLAELAAVSQSRLVPTFAAYAAALVAQNPLALERVAEEFAEARAWLLAAESAAQAAHHHRMTGASGSALAATARCKALASRCENARTPALQLAGAGVMLTTREREVATLAAGGLSNAHIAKQLVLSVRTVENHLYRAYAKLGVRSREELADRL